MPASLCPAPNGTRFTRHRHTESPMYWQEDQDETETSIHDDVVDVLFGLECRSIPVDHAYALSQALLELAPWLAEPGAAIHNIHVAGSQNGWERPEQHSGQSLQLSRRTKLCIRAPRMRVPALRAALEGKTVDVAGSMLRIGPGKERLLSREGTIFARYVVGPAGLNEEGFLAWVVDELRALDIKVRKALCGKTTLLATPEGPLETRSLMLANLTQDESIRLQQHGLGPNRGMGCGIFLAHKGIDAVQRTT
ncbi:MAG: type I-MYXAN CRISPR-associated protein Cas6/Cmx6 [Thiohalocapsa sp.]